ncbi:hypothetical protein Fmac_009421 [Flemingia macrophylla]|uniref:MLO-like protein n=1 Tax=Flemingia macrophylla TaxID=520843 RepID=A0ABD1N072_9FABA
MAEELNQSLEYTPTWIVAVVCSIIVFISLCVERAIHRLGKYLKSRNQIALFEALHKLEEELMLLGFISLLLTVFQGLISHICISPSLATQMLPCKRPRESTEASEHNQIYYDAIINRRRLFSTDTGLEHCRQKGKVPLLSLESLHHLHIFIFVLAVVHAVFCVITMVLGVARIQQWNGWEKVNIEYISSNKEYHEFFKAHSHGHWRRAAVVSWLRSFFKQFFGSVTKYDYLALRYGFVKEHSKDPKFDFHNYMQRTLEVDFRKVVGISWYLWLFVVLFLLLNLEGWHTYFWLAFLPLILLLLVGAKLEHIIARLAQESIDMMEKEGIKGTRVKPSDEYFWFARPALVLDLLHFILFQNSFEIAFFFWIWCTYGFDSCIMEKISYIIPRLIMGAIVQVLCSYSTLPLYTLVTQMGSEIKNDKPDASPLTGPEGGSSNSRQNRMIKESNQRAQIDEQAVIMVEDATSIIELT